jgi:hypothetical protein
LEAQNTPRCSDYLRRKDDGTEHHQLRGNAISMTLMKSCWVAWVQHLVVVTRVVVSAQAGGESKQPGGCQGKFRALFAVGLPELAQINFRL